jgi:hypothetical protein
MRGIPEIPEEASRRPPWVLEILPIGGNLPQLLAWHRQERL